MINKKHTSFIPISLFALALTGGIALYYWQSIHSFLEQKAVTRLYEQCGNKEVSISLKNEVEAIASELGIDKKITLKRTSSNAMQVFGYHNAFVSFPTLALDLISFNQPHLFVSEGFLDSLSKAERRFLIGHELIHAKEPRHCRHLGAIQFFIYLLLLLIYCSGGYYLFKKIKNNHAFLKEPHKKIITLILAGFFIRSFFTTSSLGVLFYRRIMEKEADMASVKALCAKEGLSLLCARWHKEMNLPWDNGYCDLFADHPSLSKRIEYCNHI